MSALEWLFALPPGRIRWGLERIRALLAGVDDPHRRFAALHIGGTNGKGSVAALCDAALRASGRRAGLYTSPHLIHFHERIRIDGAPVDERVLAAAAERLRPLVEQHDASFFEATTGLAFLLFAEAGVEIATIEVGLGGRLDATNVLHPLVSAVTDVARDHTEYLGEALTGIAAEKAGIWKRGVPALTAATDPDAVRVLRERAVDAGAPFGTLEEVCTLAELRTLPTGTCFTLRSERWGERALSIPLAGAHQARNAALAAEVLGRLPDEWRPRWEEVAQGFAGVRWPGRLQTVRLGSATWIFDVAHNAQGARTLAAALAEWELARPVVLVAGVLADKPWQEMLPPLLAMADGALFVAPPSAPPGRRWNPAGAAEALGSSSAVPLRAVSDFTAALARAATLAPYGTVVVTGSTHTVGDAMQVLGIPVP